MALGVVAAGVGVAVLAWPEGTVPVVGVLFGVNLAVTGLVRAVLSLATDAYPVAYRLLAVVFGALSVALGVLCLADPIASAVVLMFACGVGWLGDALIGVVAGVADQCSRAAARLATAVTLILALAVGLVGRGFTVDTLVVIGAVLLTATGAGEVFSVAGALRRPGEAVATFR
jgi:uncharacterized membrane protein HdeD (DUF308 family)